MTGQPAVKAPTALDWYASMSNPAMAVGAGEAGRVSIRRYSDTPAEMRQPALSENLVCMHLGGSKEVRRWHDGRMDVHSVELGAVTIMPTDQSNRWATRGPVDFVHLVLAPDLIKEIASEEFDGACDGVQLADTVGFRDPQLEALLTALLVAVESRSRMGRLYPDSLLVVLVVNLLERHSTLSKPASSWSPTPTLARGGLAPWRLRQVIDFMHEQIDDDISLDALTSLTGLSRAQFYRAFKQSTGATPHRYLTALRLDAAKAMLHKHDLEISEIGAALGLPNLVSFSALFRQRFGLTPKSYRASLM